MVVVWESERSEVVDDVEWSVSLSRPVAREVS